MQRARSRNPQQLPVTVIVGATSKWQADGVNTFLVHGKTVSDNDMPVRSRWGLGGSLAQKFATEGHFVVLTTRTRANAVGLSDAIEDLGGQSMVIELDVGSEDSVAAAFDGVRERVGDPKY
jgi:NAD(P)-dependent dehydrogenase (short-subunit alcohol dehydrogenase family)